MTNRQWDPENYKFEFPDVPAYEGPLVDMPLIHKVEKVRQFLVGDVLPEAKRCLDVHAELAALLLSLAAVDYLAGFYVGKKTTRDDFVNFMQDYFPKEYQSILDKIYDQLRSGLMHNLVGVFPWKDNNIPFVIHPDAKEHLHQNKNGQTIFSVLLFLEDIRRAWWMYAYDIVMKGDKHPDLVTKFSKRFNKLNGLGAFMVKVLD